mmetsp:Transcript_14832/g.56126  ORF Transcript_14832/g.56126 Transcript_14832/m.56126 type:complete len:249 (-) Transcript_14832:238-984(-)
MRIALLVLLLFLLLLLLVLRSRLPGGIAPFSLSLATNDIARSLPNTKRFDVARHWCRWRKRRSGCKRLRKLSRYRTTVLLHWWFSLPLVVVAIIDIAVIGIFFIAITIIINIIIFIIFFFKRHRGHLRPCRSLCCRPVQQVHDRTLPRLQQSRRLQMVPRRQARHRDIAHVVLAEQPLDELVHVQLRPAIGLSVIQTAAVGVQRLQRAIDLRGSARQAEVEGPQSADILVVLVLHVGQDDLLLRRQLQ